MGHTDGSTRKAPAPPGILTDAQELPADQQLREELQVDQQIRDFLADKGFEGPEYDQWESELIAYALEIFMGWMKTGVIFKQLAKAGGGVSPTDTQRHALMTDKDERLSITGDVVAQALARFREHALLAGGWSAEGGATLKTYFVGGALRNEFPNKIRSWLRDHDSRSRGEPCAPEDLEFVRSKPDGTVVMGPEGIVMSRDEYDTLAKQLGPEVLWIFQCLSEGYGYAAIAEMEGRGRSPAAVTEHVGRVRRQLRRERENKARSNINKDKGGEDDD